VKPFPVLYTDRLQLREFESWDIGSVFQGLSHPDVIRYYGVSYDSIESTQAQMDWFKQLYEEESGIWWAICNGANGAFIGATGFNNIDRTTHRAEIGFWLLPPGWGKGYIQEAVHAILPYGFNHLGLQSVEAIVETENQNSVAVLRKLGFQYVSTDIDCEIKNGKPISLMKFVYLRGQHTPALFLNRLHD
jgi:ribosomal-protein-alanine N-acetyltransferase